MKLATSSIAFVAWDSLYSCAGVNVLFGSFALVIKRIKHTVLVRQSRKLTQPKTFICSKSSFVAGSIILFIICLNSRKLKKKTPLRRAGFL